MDNSLQSLQRRQAQLIRRIIAVMGLASLLAALCLYAFADRIGLDPGTARLMVTAFVVAAIVDGLLIRYWDRLFGRC
jgi:hypothetical protein